MTTHDHCDLITCDAVMLYLAEVISDELQLFRAEAQVLWLRHGRCDWCVSILLPMQGHPVQPLINPSRVQILQGTQSSKQQHGTFHAAWSEPSDQGCDWSDVLLILARNCMKVLSEGWLG